MVYTYIHTNVYSMYIINKYGCTYLYTYILLVLEYENMFIKYPSQMEEVVERKTGWQAGRRHME